MDVKRKEQTKNKRRATQDKSSDENPSKRPKREKPELIPFMNPQSYDKRMQEVLKKGIEIYHDQDDTITNEDERVAYLSILKKVCNVNDWKQSRIISSEQQIKCFKCVVDLTESEKKKFAECSNNWMKHKVDNTLGNSLLSKYSAIAESYKQFIFKFGVKHEMIEDKILQMRSQSVKATKMANNVDAIGMAPVTVKKHSVDCGQCRLCGRNEMLLIINLNENCGLFQFKDLVRDYCRVDIKDDARLPQEVCIECKLSLESFIRFCDLIDKTQKTMIDKLPFPVIPIKEEVVEFEAPPSPPLSTVNKQSPKRDSTTSNQVSPDFRIESVCGSSPIVPSDFEFTPLSDEQFYDDFDPVNQLKDSQVPPSVPSKSVEAQSSRPLPKKESIEMLKSKMKICTVPIYKLPINFVPSDTESESDDDEDVQLIIDDPNDKDENVSLLDEIEVNTKNNNNYKRKPTDEISFSSKGSTKAHNNSGSTTESIDVMLIHYKKKTRRSSTRPKK